jgi:hypothetical protein
MTLVARLTGAALLTAGLALAVSPAPASAAATKSCRSVSGKAGGVDRVRVSRGFSCANARSDIGNWLSFVDERGPRPWTCRSSGASVQRWSCRLRTSFGGTKPERTFRLTFRLLDA